MFKNYGGVLIPKEECISFLKQDEILLCGFAFPDDTLRSKVIGRSHEDISLFPNLKMLFIYDLENKEIFNRVCQGEARGISWETIDGICKGLERGMDDS